MKLRCRVGLVVMSVSLLAGGCAGRNFAPVIEGDTSAEGIEATTPPMAAEATNDDATATATGDGVVVTALDDERVEAVALAAPDDMTDEPVNPAVVALLNQASVDSLAGRHDRAAATLERAVKIEPGDAWLWHRLARERLELGDYQQAQDLAARSNALAAKNRALLADNWKLIAHARRLDGDEAGAKAADLRVEQFAGG